MTKRAKIIIGVVIGLLLAGGAIAGWITSQGISSTKSSKDIKAEIEAAFDGKDYFTEVEVKSYSGAAEEQDENMAADSAAIMLTLSKMDADTFKEASSLLPELEMSAFYSIGDTTDIENIVSVTGFKSEDFKDEKTVNAIADSLKVQEEYKSAYWQISRGNAEGDDNAKMKTQFVSVSDTVADIRATVDKVVKPEMDVLPVAKTELSNGSFVQFAAVDGKMDNYDKGLEIVLNLADQSFLDGEQIVVLGLGDDIQVSYSALRPDLNKESLTEIAKTLNSEQLFQIKIVSPEDVPVEGEAPAEEAPVEGEAPAEEAPAENAETAPETTESSSPSPETTEAAETTEQ